MTKIFIVYVCLYIYIYIYCDNYQMSNVFPLVFPYMVTLLHRWYSVIINVVAGVDYVDI